MPTTDEVLRAAWIVSGSLMTWPAWRRAVLTMAGYYAAGRLAQARALGATDHELEAADYAVEQDRTVEPLATLLSKELDVHRE